MAPSAGALSGELVWAQFGKSTDPWWPAVTCAPASIPPNVAKLAKPSQTCVLFFGYTFTGGRGEYAWCSKSRMRPMFVPGESATVAPSADSGGSGAPSETTDAFQASLEKYRAQKIKKGQKEHFEVALAELLTQVQKREEDKAKAAAKKKQKDLEKARTRVAKPVEHKGTWALQPPPSWVEEVPMNTTAAAAATTVQADANANNNAEALTNTQPDADVPTNAAPTAPGAQCALTVRHCVHARW